MSDPVRIPIIQGGRAAVDKDGRPTTEFLRSINDAFGLVKRALNAIATILGITDQLSTSLASAQTAIATAQAAAMAARTAATAAQAAAATAQSSTTANAREQALVNSSIMPNSVLTATVSTITIAAHTRYYGDGTSKPVNGGTIAATAAGDTDYVSYVDATRAGGAVAYQASTTAPTQGSDVHVVGAITIPATGSAAGGNGPRKPGYVEP